MFPKLYKRTSTGAIQTWQISVYGATITKLHGQVGGKLQTDIETLTEGKNLGRSNATTPEEQARAEALSQWQRKREKHYHESIEAAQAGVTDTTVIAGGVPPMLAHTFEKQGHKIMWPAYAQPKLDGHRMIAMVVDGEVTLWSRTQKAITGVPHIARAIEALNLPDGTILDGECYVHSYRDQFEALTSFIKQATPKPGHEVVEYHVYDLASHTGPFGERTAWIAANIPTEGPVQTVETFTIRDEDEMTDLFALFERQGYEGLMIRNAASPYVGKRSYDLQKVKEFQDAEYEIVSVREGRGRMAGRAIFVCSAGGTEFSCKMAGSLEALGDVFANADDYVGQLLTVKFQGLTADGIPRFPVGLRLRVEL